MLARDKVPVVMHDPYLGRTVNGAGHVPMYDEPAQVVAQILEVTARAERDEAQQDGPRPVAA